ncbi:MAG: hypothetical protein PWQ52_946, partial [Methanolobus sp.]|nr:hypothetical protein [Methanolobus sp.]
PNKMIGIENTNHKTHQIGSKITSVICN